MFCVAIAVVGVDVVFKVQINICVRIQQQFIKKRPQLPSNISNDSTGRREKEVIVTQIIFSNKKISATNASKGDGTLLADK